MEYTDIKTKIKDLEEIPKTPENLRSRGREFENLILDYFENENILISRSYHTSDNKSEQIDGAIRIGDRVILLEIKWVESNIAASDLYAFSGKIDNKFYGTIGIFISKETLSENVINSISKGRQRKIFVLHSEDIFNLFEVKNRFHEYFQEAINVYSTDNISYFPISEHLKNIKTKEFIEKSERNISNEIKTYLIKITSKEKIGEAEIYSASCALDIDTKIHAFEYFLENLEAYYRLKNTHPFNNHTFDNIISSIKYLKLTEHTEAIELYSSHIKNKLEYTLILPQLWNIFSSKINESEALLSTVSDSLLRLLEKYFGKWEIENIITGCVQGLWDKIPPDIKNKFEIYYFEIYVSERKEDYPQKIFANKIVSAPSTEKTLNVLDTWLEQKMSEEARYFEPGDNTPQIIEKSFLRFYKKYIGFSSITNKSKEDNEQYFREKYERFVKKRFE